jgi:hypothetical protein
VLRYLQAFAEHYHLTELIHFNCQVLRVQHAPAPTQAAAAAGPPDNSTAAGAPWQKWQVQWQQIPPATSSNASSNPPTATAAAAGSEHTEQFNAVLVCNGHYSEPQLPQLPGAAGWPGLLMHSHNYRSADRFKGQHVAVLGASFSGGSSPAADTFVCSVDMYRQAASVRNTTLQPASTCTQDTIATTQTANVLPHHAYALLPQPVVLHLAVQGIVLPATCAKAHVLDY